MTGRAGCFCFTHALEVEPAAKVAAFLTMHWRGADCINAAQLCATAVQIGSVQKTKKACFATAMAARYELGVRASVSWDRFDVPRSWKLAG